jgi:hypothetical protein
MGSESEVEGIKLTCRRLGKAKVSIKTLKRFGEQRRPFTKRHEDVAPV